MSARFPNFAGKHDHDSMITPAEALAYVERTRGLPDVIPEAVVLTYQGHLTRQLSARTDVLHAFPAPMRHLAVLPETDNRVGVAYDFGIGAPVAAMVMETLAALGVRRFVSVGAAGGLQRGARIGDIVLCTSAVRDEGVSHHYVATDAYAYPSEELTKRLGDALGSPTSGPTWTIDAPYRETVEEARHYQSEGVLTVEMEAAALFAVASVRGVEVASAFVISDTLGELTWNPQFAAAEVAAGLDRLLEAAIASCLS
jgi:uridine phosphorylase